MARRRNSAMAQALAEAQLNYGPQRRDLNSALSDAGRTRTNDVRTAEISGGALANQIRQSLGPLSNDYRLAARVGDVNNNDVLNALKGQSGVGGYLATIRGDRALNATLGARELANAKGSLRLQANQALQGAVNDAANVRSTYQSLAGKIRSQLSGLSADQAKYVALNVPKIQQQMAADARAAQAARDAHRAARDLHRQRTQGPNSPGNKAKMGILDMVGQSFGQIGKTVGSLSAAKPTPTQARAVKDQVGLAHYYIQHYAPAVGLSTVKQFLTTGYSTRATKDNPSGTHIPKITGQGTVTAHDIINSAADLHVHGRLSVPNYNALYGVPIPPAWHPPGVRRRGSSRALRGLGAGTRSVSRTLRQYA